MDFELTDEQQLIREAVREFAQAEVAPIAGELDRDHRFPHELLPKMAELNIMGMPFPDKFGGAGADEVSYVISVEEISRACASTGCFLLPSFLAATTSTPECSIVQSTHASHQEPDFFWAFSRQASASMVPSRSPTK